MKTVKHILNQLLHPPAKTVARVDLIAIPLTIIALGKYPSTHPVSLIAYILSSYALVITILNSDHIYRHIKAMIRDDKIPAVVWFKKLMKKNKYTEMYLESVDFRTEVSLYTGLGANIVFAVFKAFSGAYYHSSWLASVGAYYLVYCSIRYMLMRNYRRHKNEEWSKTVRLHEYRTARTCGIMMLLLNLAVAGMA